MNRVALAGLPLALALAAASCDTPAHADGADGSFALMAGGPGPTAQVQRPFESPEEWRRRLLQRLLVTPRVRYSGELLVVSWPEAGERAEVLVASIHSRRGELVVEAPEEYTVELGRRRGGVVHHADGWFVPLPGTSPGHGRATVEQIEEKYQIDVAGRQDLLGRPTALLDLTRRDDGLLRERLWVDEETGVPLRRQTYDEQGTMARLVALLSMTVDGRDTRTRPDRAVPLVHRKQDVIPVASERLDALRDSGWTLPSALPGGYMLVGVYAVAAADSQPLQVVYRDGLYTVSFYQQHGRPRWDTLPEGAQRAEWADWTAYEWPGAVPRRLVWEASGKTFILVGDAPPDEFTAIAASLPKPLKKGIGERLRTGLSKIGRWVSPWH